MNVNINEICRLKKAELGLSNKKIAELSGIPEPTVSSFLGPNAKSPSFETAYKVCRTLGVSIDAHCGIIDPSMGKEEINRIMEQYEGKIEEHNRLIDLYINQEKFYEQTISKKDDIINEKEIIISEKNRIIQNYTSHFQFMKNTIRKQTIALFTFAVYSFFALLVFYILR